MIRPKPNGQRSLRDAAREGKKQVAPPLQESTQSPQIAKSEESAQPAPVCQKCIRRAEQDRKESAARAEANKRRREGVTSRQRKQKERRERMKHARLPDNSEFVLRFDIKTQRWTGTLTVQDQTFVAETSAVLDLPPRLDSLYREWLQKQGVSDG